MIVYCNLAMGTRKVKGISNQSLKGQIRFSKFSTKMRKMRENHITQMKDEKQQLWVTNRIISTLWAANLNGLQEALSREKSPLNFAPFGEGERKKRVYFSHKCFPNDEDWISTYFPPIRVPKWSTLRILAVTSVLKLSAWRCTGADRLTPVWNCLDCPGH